MGKPLKSIRHTRPDIPIWLGTGGDANVRLTAELADGWLPFGFRPGSLERYRPLLDEGFARAGGGKSLADFEIQAGCTISITDDVQAAIDAQKPFTALYVGGMGHEKMNFHKERMKREGYPEAAERIQELFLAGKREEAIAAVPDEYIEEGSLLGTPERIRELYRERWEGCGATGLTVRAQTEEELELMAELAGTRDA
jgi:alkanesulfonate monooxygenase SsuD/methylene tetrahydromethanopterin reductase-like flavin-dependent oxidoreductase (luciferase family)